MVLVSEIIYKRLNVERGSVISHQRAERHMTKGGVVSDLYMCIARLYNFVLVDFTFSVGLWAFRCLVCIVH